MAKRTPRTEANDVSPTAAEPQARPEKASRRRAPREAAESAYTATRGGSESTFAQPSEEDIRKRAYMRYLERGGLQGLEFEDWFEAERELKRRK